MADTNSAPRPTSDIKTLADFHIALGAAKHLTQQLDNLLERIQWAHVDEELQTAMTRQLWHDMEEALRALKENDLVS